MCQCKMAGANIWPHGKGIETSSVLKNDLRQLTLRGTTQSPAMQRGVPPTSLWSARCPFHF